MNKYIIQFNVNLENDITDLIFFRSMSAKNNNELQEKVDTLKNTFQDEFHEVWRMEHFWIIPSDIPIESMTTFMLTDNLIGWKPD